MSEESDLPVTTTPVRPPAEKRATMSEAFQAITDMATRLGVAASARDHAKDVFSKMEERKGKAHHYYTKGRCDTLYVACLYFACRSEGAPRTLKELAAATRDGAATRKDIGKLITLIKKRLGDEAGRAGCRNTSTVAAIIYMAIDRLAEVPKSFWDVSVASGVAEGTIKQAYRELCPHAELLFA